MTVMRSETASISAQSNSCANIKTTAESFVETDRTSGSFWCTRELFLFGTVHHQSSMHVVVLPAYLTSITMDPAGVASLSC